MTVAKQSLLILAPSTISTARATAREERWRRLAVSATLSVVDPNRRRNLPGQTNNLAERLEAPPVAIDERNQLSMNCFSDWVSSTGFQNEHVKRIT